MTGLGPLLAIQWRTRRRTILLWVVALVGSMLFTAVAVAGLYDTPEKVPTYAEAVASDALVAINGRVEGLDTLGGIVQDEFGFMASFLMPLVGIVLIAGMTRREEETGRLEQLLGGRMDRRAPATSALLVVLATTAVTVVGFVVSLLVAGIPTSGAVLYSLALGLLTLVFAALAALLAQVMLHSRGVYAGSLAVLAVAYVLRGVGDVKGWWVTWLSPLGWVEKAAPFGDEQRWWALLVPLVVSLGLAVGAVALAERRDLGSSLWRSGAGPDRASGRLLGSVGFAAHVQRMSFAGWLVGSALLAAVMGAMAQEVVDAVLGNPELAGWIALGNADPAEGFLAVVELYLAILACGYVVQALGTLRREEVEGRLEPQLGGTVGRWHWLAAQVVVVLAGLVVITLVSALLFGATTAWSTGDSGYLGSLLAAGFAYLPAVLVVAGLAVALFGLVPRAYAVAWAAFGLVAFVAFVGEGLQLPQWVLDLSPTTHVGTPPQGDVETGALVVLSLVAVALVAAGFAAFRRRFVPQG
jgi:ABC-2 type transport system permease protein